METRAGQLINALRRRCGLTQAELARRAGLPRSVLNAYERGRREPGAETLDRVLNAGGSELQMSPPVRRLDHDRAARILAQVIALAEALPYRPRPLHPSPFRTRS